MRGSDRKHVDHAGSCGIGKRCATSRSLPCRRFSPQTIHPYELSNGADASRFSNGAPSGKMPHDR
jgi:hypothetical protein